jgi:hypothetical protein
MSLNVDLATAIKKVCKNWKKAKRHADRNDRVSYNRIYRMRYYEPRETIRRVAFELMGEAYLKASSNGKYPANARQIYYAIRPEILNRVGIEELNSQYFTQVILKDYLEIYRPPWDVVWDARGHLLEPHTRKIIGLGGLEIRNYISEFTSQEIDSTPSYEPEILLPTIGPVHRFKNILFIEKEGFSPLLEVARIPERYDIAVTSSKGMPVAALCDLLLKMSELNITVFCLHDFDVSGFSILKTLKQGARGSHGSGKVIDLGFRIDDIRGLQSEPVIHRSDITKRLIEAGATKEEIEFLESSRVELNAMTCEQFIAWLENKLMKSGVRKYIPNQATINEAYKRALYLKMLEEKSKELQKEFSGSAVTVPDNLIEIIDKFVKKNPENSWDEALWSVVNGNKYDSELTEKKVVKIDFEAEKEANNEINSLLDKMDKAKAGGSQDQWTEWVLLLTNLFMKAPDLEIELKREYEKDIFRRFENGESLGQIAADYGISEERANQIIEKKKKKYRLRGCQFS